MSWGGVAQHFGVKLCSECGSGDHRKGWTSNGLIHWGPRRLTKLGLRRYLMLIAEARIVRPETEWERLYAHNLWASLASRDIGVRIPARYSDNDRARVYWLISKQTSVPAHIRRWAKGRSNEHRSG